ncbi:PGF-CTERM sorting domain-containing protein [Haloarchaeobius sp. FL176]|uniref:FG-GAP repeat protein n=1 Tax=Haloarchaeobius sp. FL176 TaxID=2967129 RepID=UPI0021488E71
MAAERSRSHAVTSSGAPATVGASKSSRADDWSQQAELVANDRDESDYFGSGVAVSRDGTTAIIGAPGDDSPNGEDGGSAYVFERTGEEWSQQTKLAPDDGNEGGRFGGSVSISRDGTTAVIGAYLDDGPNGDNTGSAYVYNATGEEWSQQAKLAPDDGDENDAFGASIAVSDDGATVIIGAPSDTEPNGEYGGSAYVFEQASGEWTQQTKLASDDGAEEDYFGGSVALSGGGMTAILGAAGDDGPNGEAKGSAYVFEAAGDEWAQQTKLTAPDGDEGDGFGGPVAISRDGTIAFFGANGDEDPNGEGAGSAYVFDRDNGDWTQQAKLAPDDGDPKDSFGRALAVSSDGMTLIVGAFTDENPNGENAGSAYVFDGSDGDWSQQEKLMLDDGDNADSFGITLGVSGDGTTTVIGANGDGFPSDFQAGSAYVFATDQQPAGPTAGQTTEEPTGSESDEDDGGSIPGFGVGSVVAGLTGAVYLLRRANEDDLEQ